MQALMVNLVAVAIGGALGAMARYGASLFVASIWGRDFPWATLSVNVLGSLFMGMLYSVFLQASGSQSTAGHLMTVGFLGAFTTFSAFSLEMVNLMAQERWLAATGYAASSVIVCVLACAAGVRLMRWVA